MRLGSNAGRPLPAAQVPMFLAELYIDPILVMTRVDQECH